MLKEVFLRFELFLVAVFVTIAIPVGRGSARHYVRETGAAQVPAKIVARAPPQPKREQPEIGKLAAWATKPFSIRASTVSVMVYDGEFS